MIVKEGSVEIRMGVGGNRKLMRLALLHYGGVFGGLSFFDEKPHAEDAISAGPGEAYFHRLSNIAGHGDAL